MRPYIDCHNHIGRTIDRVPPVGQNTAMCLTRFAETHIHAAISMPTAVGSPISRGSFPTPAPIPAIRSRGKRVRETRSGHR